MLLAELARTHLLTAHSPGRYALHDLLRAYAAEQAHTHDSDDARTAAVGRVLDHCLHTAHAAAAHVREPRREQYSEPPRDARRLSRRGIGARSTLLWEQ